MLAASSPSSSLAPPPASLPSVVDACRAVGSKKACVCPVFGFDASLYAAVFEDSALREAGVVAARSATAEDVAAFHPAVAVGFVKAVQLRGDVSELQGIVHALAESSTAALAGKGQLLLALETDPSADEGAQTDKVRAVVAEAWAMLPKEASPLQGVEVTVVPVPRGGDSGAAATSIRSKLMGIAEHDVPLGRTGSDLAASLTGRQQSSGAAAAAAAEGKVAAAEARAVAACSAVADALVRDVRGRVAALVKAGGAAPPSGALPIADVAAAVAEALEDNHRVHAAVFARHAGSDALKAASFQARAGLLALLQPLYRRAVESLRTGSMRVFENVILRVPPNRRLQQVLRAQAAAVQSNFVLKTEELKKAFVGMLGGVAGPSLLSGGPWVHRGGAGGGTWAVGVDSQLLRSQLAEACADRERYLFLQGAYNPYVRDLPFPPTKLSFHYLLDPRAMAFSRTYDRLYDEHVDGPALSRAQPLLVPGVADMPFDPNEHAVPKENRPWWQVLQEFYKS